MAKFVEFALVLTALLTVVTSSAVLSAPLSFDEDSTGISSSSDEIPCDAHCYNVTIYESTSPVCGSDGVTYLTLEELECVRHSCQRDIRVRRFGNCRRKDMTLNFDQSPTPVPPPSSSEWELEEDSGSPISHAIVTPSSLVVPHKKVCIPDECGCSEVLQPICGSDSVTYGNECLMDCNRECKPDLVKFHDGPCDKLFFKKKLKTCNPDECECSDDLKPVCGSDRVTYGSYCLLECNRNCNPSLMYHHEGYCGRLFYPTSDFS